MKTTFTKLLVVLLFFFSACKEKKRTTEKSLTFTERVQQLPDSTKVGDIVIKNLFKYQILAHEGNQFDSLMIVKNVYESHKALWDNCYGMIFGEENASKFNNPSGMVGWNKTLYPENKEFFNERAKELLDINLDSVLQTNLNKFETLVPYKPKARISILFSPILEIGFGGCNKDQFCMEINDKNQEIKYLVEIGIPHELHHLVYEPFREEREDRHTALAQAIEEGFSCYFTLVFFDGKISKQQSVDNMTKEDWEWYLENEKKIFQETKTYFEDESGDNPLLRNDKYKLFEKAPQSLFYWLGFRIIEKYVEKHGSESWRDIYTLNAQELLDKSGYEEYINGLK